METNYFISFIILTLLALLSAFLIYKTGKDITNNEQISSKQKTIKLLFLIGMALLVSIIYLSNVYIPGEVHSVIEVQETIPQTHDYIQYNNEYVTYYEDNQLERIHLNDKTKIFLGNADKYTTIKVDKKVYTSLFGEVGKVDVLEIELK